MLLHLCLSGHSKLIRLSRGSIILGAFKFGFRWPRMPKEQPEFGDTPCSPVSSEFPVTAVIKGQPSVTVDFKTFSKEYSEKWKVGRRP